MTYAKTAKPEFREIKACRLCGCKSLDGVIDFDNVPLGNNLQDTPEQALCAAAYPLQLNRCLNCGHFQLGHAVNPKLLYATNYTYLSGVGKSFVRHFEQNALWAVKKANLKVDDLVVDIGSNDGTCLKYFQQLGMRVCGVDPATLPVSIANQKGVPTLEAFFDAEIVNKIITKYGQAQYVTSHNVLAHVDNLRATFDGVYSLLADGGWFGFEIGYFREVLANNLFDTVYHEHLDYHHASALAQHLTGLGFDIVELDVTSVQGGSLRLLLQKTGEGRVHGKARAFLDDERNGILNDRDFLKGWVGTIKSRMHNFGKTVRDAASAGQTVVGYGAPTKATLLLRFAGIGSSNLQYVVEDNPHKVGRYLPGSAIPILSNKLLAEQQPDMIVILAWNFADDILKKLRCGGISSTTKVVVPLPNLRLEQI